MLWTLNVYVSLPHLQMLQDSVSWLLQNWESLLQSIKEVHGEIVNLCWPGDLHDGSQQGQRDRGLQPGQDVSQDGNLLRPLRCLHPGNVNQILRAEAALTLWVDPREKVRQHPVLVVIVFYEIEFDVLEQILVEGDSPPVLPVGGGGVW